MWNVDCGLTPNDSLERCGGIHVDFLSYLFPIGIPISHDLRDKI